MKRRPRPAVHREHPPVQRTAHTARARVQRRHHPHPRDNIRVLLRHRLPRHRRHMLRRRAHQRIARTHRRPDNPVVVTRLLRPDYPLQNLRICQTLRHTLPHHGGNARFLRIGIMADKRRKQRLGINPLHRQHPCVQQRRQSRRRYRLHIRRTRRRSARTQRPPPVCRTRRRQCSALWFVAGYRNRRFAMTEAAAILEKLNQIQQTQQKSWLAALTEKSAPAHTPASSPPQNKSAPHHHPTPCACATVPPQASPAAA